MKRTLLYQLENLRARLGTFEFCVDHLEIEQGEVLALVGPTGAGKTTLLRLLGGLLTAEQGRLDFGTHRLAEREPEMSVRRRITLVHQRPVLLTGSVRYNVEYGLRVRGEHGSRQKVDEVLERLGLDGIANQSGTTLSGGQVQLVALARAMVIRPEVLLLDEPTAHLDPAHVALVEQAIRQMCEEQGTTIVWATHNLFQARRVACRTGLILSGRLVEAAPTERFFEAPADPRTADFVHGRMVY